MSTLLKVVPSEKLLYGRSAAAAALDLSTGAIDTLIESGKLQAIRIGRRVLITAESLKLITGSDHAPSKDWNREEQRS
jgi:excisionase family DNA binding protein